MITHSTTLHIATHFWLAAGLFFAATARADLKLPALFSDHKVLQRDVPVPVWRWAAPGEQVTVSAGGQSVSAKADPK